MLVSGVEPNCIFDVGVARSNGDVLSMRGVVQANRAAAIALKSLQYLRALKTGARHVQAPTTASVIGFSEEFSSELDAALKWRGVAKEKNKELSVAYFGAAVCLAKIARVPGLDETLNRIVRLANLSENSAAHSLRKQYGGTRWNASDITPVALAIKAIQFEGARRDTVCLRLGPKESLPTWPGLKAVTA